MAIQWADESVYMQEMTKWNRPKRDGGMNCNGHEEYPRMLYKAQRNPISGKMEVAMARDVISADKTVVILSAEQFNSTCQLTVNDQSEYDRAISDGWRKSQAEAMLHEEELHNEIALAAAYRAAEDAKMSAAARAEVKAAEEATPEHLAEMPRKPLDRMAKARAAKAAKKANPASGLP